MAIKIAAEDYRALAELRYRIRQFLREGDAAARQAGLEPQQFSMLLAVRGLPEETKATIRTLAERLALEHNSAVELIDRLEKHRYVRRNRSRDDRRCVLVSLLPRGERLLQQVVRQRLSELRAGGAELVNAIDALLGRKTAITRKKKRGQYSQESGVKQK